MAIHKKLMCGVAPAALFLMASMSLGHAADPVGEAPLAGTPFTGFYIGAHAGYGSADYEGRWSSGSPMVGFNYDGALFGLHAGHNWEIMQNVILGVEGDVTVAPWNGSYSFESTYAVFGHLSGIASLRGRLGYVLDDTLLYATGGVAFASSNSGAGGTIQHNRKAELITGAVAGAGIEWLVTPSLALRAEGLYYWFDQKDRVPGESGFGGIQDTWLARVGASWYFDGSEPMEDLYGAPAGDAFSGFYVGGHTGYGSAEYKGAFDTGSTEGAFDNAGYLVGGHAGYNWTTQSYLMVGIEGDITVAPWNASLAQSPGSSSFTAGQLSGIASLRARLGYQIDKTLIYATGGVAFASSQGSGGGTLEFNKKAEFVTGAVAGAGLEWMVSENVALRAEGLYYWFDQEQSGNQGSGSGGIQDTWMARVGASYYFDPASSDDAEPFVADFAGVYLGGSVGYGSAGYDGTADVSGGSSDEGSPDFSGYLVGGHIGYNWQVADMAIAGVEADLSLNPWLGAEATDHDSVFVTGQLSGLASLRGRLGVQMDRSLIYATGGVAFASSGGSGSHTMQLSRRSEVIVGPVAGAGLEWMATEKLSLRAEGMHYWFDQTDSGNGGSGEAGIQNTWLARVGASWHFN
jgi:outer membrane immunogenic protein